MDVFGTNTKIVQMGNPPKSKLDFWLPKLERNKNRDRKIHAALLEAGWSILDIWECELKNAELLKEKVIQFIEGGNE